ncbi:MAG TPA: phosphotransferase [Thermoanaerobaculia bacterium]|nr:phosphotransferase [Thermoanaerobaculia bacterium]
MSETPRELRTFLRECLGERFRVDPLAGDASARAYYRVSTGEGGRWMAAYYPEDVRPGLEQFLGAWRALAPHAPLPEVVRAGSCAILQQDVGDVTLFEVLETDRGRGIALYRRAVDLLIALQGAEAGRELNPPFTAEFFAAELAITREFWVQRMCGVEGAGALGRLATSFERLCAALERHPQVLCHRDYHGQNLHVFEDRIYVIDYQDLRLGPDTYDLASLLRDRGVARALRRDAENELIEYYRHRTGGDDGLRRRYFETLLQRSIKIVGTFARQSITRGRHHYLAYIPPTLESIRLCVDQLPEYRDLLESFPLETSETQPAIGPGR